MKSLKSHLLIASPALLDPNFAQSVVLMVQHDENGALGLILNRPTNMTVKEAWEQVSEVPCGRADPLYVGGPCEGVLMALHPIAEAGQIEVLPGLFFASETEHITAVLDREEPHIRFFVGYSGWEAGQLEREMESGSWQVAPATTDRVFSPVQSLWKQIKRESAFLAIAGKINPKLIPTDPARN